MKHLLFILLSLLSLNTLAWTGSGGSFGGGGASGSWGSDLVCFVDNESTNKTDSFLATCENRFKKSFYEVRLVPNGNSVGIVGVCQQFNPSNPGFTVDSVNVTCRTANQCPEGYQSIDGKCQPKKCPVGETLVNGQCKKKQCPAGQALDKNGNCMFSDDQCPVGQSLVNGRCAPISNSDDSENEESEWPPFCEWANEMCSWHKEWQQWSNDYNSNEQKANLDREELKRIGLDSKENLSEINQKMTEQNQKLEALKIPLDQIKQQNQQFYDEVRLWLKNYNPEDGNPSEQNPSIDFPPFCDWSVQVCNWYLDWQDWRTDYTANNEEIKQRLDRHLERLQEMKDQDKQHYNESKSFFKDVRDFFDWYKDQEDEPPPEPEQPEQPEEPKPPEPDEEQRVNWQASCPVTEQSQSIVLEGQTTTLDGFDMTEACSTAIKMKPLILLAGALISLLIIARGHS